MSEQRHIPYEAEAQLFTDILQFFSEKLPHAVGDTVEHIDEAALSSELFRNLSLCSDEELADMGIHRDDIPKVSAAATGLFIIANSRNNA
ncbi:MAG TPA: DUF1127 domain-containing protein [Alphaproteobacteria bacterium]|nr:DUF1127 domain-containing protein [Alphaproteobacteria bacterium]